MQKFKSLNCRWLLFVLTPILFFSACKNFKDLECTGINGFKVNQLSAEGISGDLLLEIKNPNNLGFSIYKSEFDVKYSGIYLGKAKLTERVRIKGNSSGIYSFNLKSDFKNVNLLDVLKLLSGATRQSVIEVKGDLKAGKLFFRKKFPVAIKEKVGLD